MKKFFYTKYLSGTLIIAFILNGCNHPSIEESQPHDTIPLVEIEHTSVVDTAVTNSINSLNDVQDITKLKERYKEVSGFVQYKYRKNDKALSIEMRDLDNAFFHQFVKLACADLSEESGWLSHKLDVIKSIHGELNEKYNGRITDPSWDSIDQALSDYKEMCSYKNRINTLPRNVYDMWNSNLWYENPRYRNEIILARNSPIYQELSHSNLRNKFKDAHYKFVNRLTSYKIPNNLVKQVETEISDYDYACENVYHNTANVENQVKEMKSRLPIDNNM